MRTVIKSNGAESKGAVRPLGLRRPLPQGFETPVDPEVLALHEETARLREQLARQDEEIAAHGAALEDARQAGEAAGRLAALEEAQDGQAERLAAITHAADEALAQFTLSQGALEQLAPSLALAGLEKVLGPSEDRRRLMVDLISQQLVALRGQTVLQVDVSNGDFDADGIAELARQLGGPPFKVVASDALEPGDCRLTLQLGGVEIGFGQQLERLRDVLQSLTRTTR